MYGMPLLSSTGIDVPQTSMPPVTATTSSLTRRWAQAVDPSGEKPVSQVRSSSGRPSIPPSSAFTNSTAARAARVSSGKAPTAPVSWLIMPIRIGGRWPRPVRRG